MPTIIPDTIYSPKHGKKDTELNFNGKSLNVKMLSQRLSHLDTEQTRQKRLAYNFVYHEALSFEEKGRGIPFDKVLRALTYKLIDPEQFLK